jgi:hypothetical protein
MRNEHEVFDGVIFIRLSNGMTALADESDLPKLTKLDITWTADADHRRPDRFYAVSKPDGTITSMHRYLLDYPPCGLEVDHANHDGLDNRRKNLRAVPHWKNAMNRTRASGRDGTLNVYFDAKRGKWRACVRRKHLGYFECKEQAVEVATKAKAALMAA